MLKGCKILTSFCVICATLYGGAYGAASVRGGATSRAGSIRTFGAGTTASVKTTTARPQPTVATAVDTGNTETAGGARMPVASGLSGSKLPGRISGNTSSSGDSQNVAELRQAIEQLRNDYDALGEQYNNLSSDISNVSDTAQVARDVAANNTNTLTLVRTDLSVAQSDIEDLKANGGLDEEAVQEALNTTLAQRNYATRGELAATDAVARGAVQVADLPQRLNALNIADKDYVASQALGAVNDSLNITLGNYYTKGQVNDAIGQAKLGMVDKDYVDDQVRGLAPKNYVDARVAAIEGGVNEDAVQGIVNNSIGTRLANYYTKGDIDDALVDAVADAKAGMADRDYVNNQVRDVTSYVDEKVAEVETGVDTGTLYNILETRGYKTGSEVQGIVRDSLNETMANYYTGAQVDTAIAKAKAGMVDRNQVDNMIDGLAAQNWVTGQINTVNNRISALPLGLDQDAVKGVVEEYGYKTEEDVRGIVTGYNYAKADDIPNMIAELAPGADIQYDNGVLIFKDKNGNQQTVDIRGLDGQDGAQVELQKNGDKIQWRYESDTAWHDLVNVSDLRGVDGKSVELGVQTMTVEGMPIKDALVYKKDGENNWQFLYNLDNIAGADGCGIKVETNDYVSGGALLGKTVKLLRDCPASSLDGAQLTSFNVLNGADGTVTEEQIIDALESNPTFVQLKNKVNKLETDQVDTHNLAADVYDVVNNGTTGLVATNTLANKAWSKVEDLEATNKTARVYVDDRIGDLGMNQLTWQKFTSVADKLGNIGYTQTVAEYVNEQFSKINTTIEVRRDSNGYVYICNKGTCSSDPHPYSNEWTQISVDLTGYLTKSKADDLYAPISLVSAVDTAQSAATQAQTQASQSWGKLSDLGNLTVKDYVDNYVGDVVGNLGFNVYANKAYNVADKLGFTNTSGTVKEYIDSAVRSVNTTIQVDQYNGQTYICKKNKCTTPAGPYYPEDWAQITVDVSGYLTQNDADNRYATITALNGVQTTANEAKTTAAAAQQTANQAQNAANSAQSKADDAWGKLSDLGNTTVREFVEDKVSGLGTTIDVSTVGGVTYICKIGKCLDTPPSSYWEPITVTISDEYLTESEGNSLYAPKAEYALKSDIGTLGGSFTSVGAKIGLNDYQYGNTSVKDYIDNKVSNISTNIQVQTSTVDGFTYICRTGSGCTGEPSQNPSQWAKVNVDLGTLGTNPSSGQAYNVATKIGLTDGANINKTVVQYITDKIGTLGNYTDGYGYSQPHSVLTYLQANYVPLTKLGSDITGTNQTVAEYIGGKIGNLGYYTDTSGYPQYYTNVKDYVDRNFALKTTIGDLGSQYTGAPSYTVADKIGLTGTNSSKTVVQYIGEKIGNLGTSYQSVADKLGSEVGSNQTVAQYIAAQIATVNTSIVVKSGTDGNTYICTGSDCTTHAADPNYDSTNWTKLNVDLSGINSILAGFGGTGNPATVKGYVDDKVGLLGNTDTSTPATSVAAKLGSDITDANKTVAAYIGDRIGNLGSYSDGYNTVYYNVASKIGLTGDNAGATVKGYVDNVVNGLATETYVGNKIGNLGNTAANTPAASVADKLGSVITSADKTVAQYIADYVAANTSSGGVTTKTVLVGGVYKTYICSGDHCDNDPPCGENDTSDTCGWQELNINLTEYLKSSVAADTYLPQSGLRLVRNGEKIYLKQMNGDTVLHNYGEIANVSEFMCASYRMEKLESGDDGYVAGKESFKLICNTNE